MNAQRVWDRPGNELMMKAHLAYCVTKNECANVKSGAQIGTFSLTDFYSYGPFSEAIRQLAYPWGEAVFNASVLKEHVSHAPPLRTISLLL